jgi:hypothetical protein
MTARPLTSEDRLAVAELIARYNWTIDTRDVDAFVEVFHEDGAFDGNQVHAGREALRAFAAGMAVAPGAQGLQHWTTNLVIEGEGDEIRARSYMVGPKITADGPIVLALLGHYDDYVSRRAGEWRFSKRVFRRWEPIAV